MISTMCHGVRPAHLFPKNIFFVFPLGRGAGLGGSYLGGTRRAQVKLQDTVIDSDISLIGTDNSEVIRKLIVQNKIKGKSRRRVGVHQ